MATKKKGNGGYGAGHMPGMPPKKMPMPGMGRTSAPPKKKK